jgi:uncharacterized RDD family membrane protein YckC
MSTGHRVPYAGIATRAVALAIDAALAQVIVFAGGAVVALVGSLVGGLQFGTLARVVSALAWVAVVGGWFVVFWTTAGQTPGMRLLGLRVVGPDGGPPAPGRALVRLAALAVAIIPAFAGFLPVLVDDRRRGLHDFAARTVVLYDGYEHEVAAPRGAADPAARRAHEFQA